MGYKAGRQVWPAEKQQRRARRECVGAAVGSRCSVVVLRRAIAATEPPSRRTLTFCRYLSYSFGRWLSVAEVVDGWDD